MCLNISFFISWYLQSDKWLHLTVDCILLQTVLETKKMHSQMEFMYIISLFLCRRELKYP